MSPTRAVGRGTRLARWGCAVAAWLVVAPNVRADGPPRVTAVDPSGHPVPGATVLEAVRDPDGRYRVDATAPALGVLDERGVLTPLPTLRERTSRRVIVAAGRVATLIPDVSDAVTVRLDPSKSIVGTLVDERGAPVSDAALRIVAAAPKRGADLPESARELAFRVVPDAKGAFSLSIAPDVPLDWFVVRHDGRLESAAGFVSGGQIRVERGSALAGRLIELEGGKGAPALTVALRPVDEARHAATDRAAEPVFDAPQAPDAADAPPVAELSMIRATSDESGRLRFFDVPPGVYEAELFDARYAFDGDPPRVDAAGTAPRHIETWWVRRRASVVGRVVHGVTRFPIAGATVLLAPPSSASPSIVRPVESPVFTTTADGRFRIDGVLPGKGYRLAVVAPGFAPVVETFDCESGLEINRTDVLLLAARTVRVTVVDEEARPVAGAAVRVTPMLRPEPDPADPVSALFARIGTSDATGLVVLTGVSEGELLLTARREGYVEGRATAHDPGAGLERSERIAMAHRASIDGLVRFADRPHDGIRVRGRGRASGEVHETTPGTDGRFVLASWGTEPVDVEVVSPSASADGFRSIVLARRESVIAGAREIVMLDVPALRRVSGDVDGLDGTKGVAHVRLEVERYDPAFDDVRWSIVEDRALAPVGAHATFEFLSIPPGKFAVRAIEGSRDTGPIELRVEAGDVDGLSLLMPAAARVSGRVVDGIHFQAALGAMVRLVRLESEMASPTAGSSVGAPRTAITRDDGGFEFDDVAPGRYRVEAGDDGVATAATEQTVREGEGIFVPLRLEAGGAIEGVITDGNARPLATVPVRVSRLPNDEPVDRTRTSETGTFRSRSLAPGHYRLRLEAGRGIAAGLEADVEVVAGATSTVDLSSRGDASIEGIVRRRGSPVPGLLVEAQASDARGTDHLTLRTTADAFGQYRFPGLSEGAYLLSIIDGAVRGASPVHVRAGDRIQQDLEVGEGRISGRVTTTKGDAVREAEVIAIPQTGREAAIEGRVRTAPDGTFSISGLPIAKFRLLVTPAGRPTRIVENVLSDLAGQEQPVELVLGRGARLELTVKDDRRRAVSGADVWVDDAKGQTLHPRALRTGSMGRLVVDGLPEGRCFVRVRAPGYGRTIPQAVDFKEGITSSVEVIVKPAGAIALTVRAGFDPRSRARVDLYRMPGRIPVEQRKTLRRPEDCGCIAVTGRTGMVVMDDLEEGNYLIVVTAGRELAPLEREVYVRAGETEPVSAQLLPARR